MAIVLTLIIAWLGLATALGADRDPKDVNPGKTIVSGGVLAPGAIARSPNDVFECIAAKPLGADDGVTLILMTKGTETAAGSAWVFLEGARTASVFWSPDSQWLLVFDNFGSGENRYIIYRVAPAGLTLFKNGAIAKDEQITWDVKEWHIEKNELVLSKQVRFGGPEKEEVIELKP